MGNRRAPHVPLDTNRCATHTHERIKVHDADAFVDVVESADYSHLQRLADDGGGGGGGGADGAAAKGAQQQQQQQQRHAGGRSRRGPQQQQQQPPRERVAQESAAMRNLVREREQALQTEELRREADKRAAELKEQSDRDFHLRLETLVRANGELKEKGRALLDTHRSREFRKKEMLHQQWSKAVFYPIQDAISDIIEKQSSQQIEGRRNRQYQEYLQEGNRKVGVFRDIVVEADYDPIAHRGENTARAQLPQAIVDPTHLATNLLEGRSRGGNSGGGGGSGAADASLLSSSTANETAGSSSKARSRVVLNVTLWDRVEATPYAHLLVPPPPCQRPAGGDFLNHIFYFF